MDPLEHITGVLHWQGRASSSISSQSPTSAVDAHCSALVLPKELAFAAPMIFFDKSDILSGTPQNGLCPLEDMLKQAHEARSRLDLAQCVVDGRKHHLLFAVLTHPHQLALINAFRRAWLGDAAEAFDSLEEWYAWGGRTFPDDTYLHRILADHKSPATLAFRQAELDHQTL